MPRCQVVRLRRVEHVGVERRARVGHVADQRIDADILVQFERLPPDNWGFLRWPVATVKQGAAYLPLLLFFEHIARRAGRTVPIFIAGLAAGGS